jgi:3-oxoacyl-[acyl-carrier-protein] synthase II
MDEQVVITGIGAVTPVGTGRERFWPALLAGECGVGPVEAFDTRAYSVHRGAEVKGFRGADYVARLPPERLGRTSQLAIASSRLALADAGLGAGDYDPERTGVCLGTTSGEPQLVERLDDAYLRGAPGTAAAAFCARYPGHVLAAHVAAELGLAGPCAVLPAACAAGNYALAHAYDLLRAGRADLVLAGGADSFSRITYTGFARLGAIAPEVCQPFDRRRKGMIPGEGAAVLTLETLARARARRARVYAAVVGYGLSCDAYHMTGMHPEGRGAVRAMTRALADSGTGVEEVDYVSAHGTGTVTNDRVETLALKQVFGEAAYRVPVSSVKSMLGHTMGAASAIEAAVCALAVYDGRIPPTIHLDDADPECDLDYVPNHQRVRVVDIALNNAYGFGGSNSSLVLKKCVA